jgi:hypothetical protein
MLGSQFTFPVITQVMVSCCSFLVVLCMLLASVVQAQEKCQEQCAINHGACVDDNNCDSFPSDICGVCDDTMYDCFSDCMFVDDDLGDSDSEDEGEDTNSTDFSTPDGDEELVEGSDTGGGGNITNSTGPNNSTGGEGNSGPGTTETLVNDCVPKCSVEYTNCLVDGCPSLDSACVGACDDAFDRCYDSCRSGEASSDSANGGDGRDYDTPTDEASNGFARRDGRAFMGGTLISLSLLIPLLS